MERGTLRERDRLFVRRASLVDFGMVVVIDKRLCLHAWRSSVGYVNSQFVRSHKRDGDQYRGSIGDNLFQVFVWETWIAMLPFAGRLHRPVSTRSLLLYFLSHHKLVPINY